MKKLTTPCLLGLLAAAQIAHSAIFEVNSTNYPAGAAETNLVQAINMANASTDPINTITFNLSGAGPFYLDTPVGGYPFLSKDNTTLDGYSQPGAVPNSNTILSNNNAQIKIVLDSRNNNYTSLEYSSGTNSGEADFDASLGFSPDAAVLCIFRGTNIHIRGLSILSPVGYPGAFCISVRRDVDGPATGAHVSGCWLGVDPNGTTVQGDEAAVESARHKIEVSYTFTWRTNTSGDPMNPIYVTNTSGAFLNPDTAHRNSARDLLDSFRATFDGTNGGNEVLRTNFVTGVPSNIDGTIVGVAPAAATDLAAARAQFNVMCGWRIPVALQGHRHRTSGNFVGVLPSGTNDYIVPLQNPGVFNEAALEYGRGASDLIIGTDGDGINDAEERNILGGAVTGGTRGGGSTAGSVDRGGYPHIIELFSRSDAPGDDRQRTKIAGNWFGIGVDGVTRFTNGVHAINGSTSGSSQYWIGSDFDGVSDDIEANVFYGNYPGIPGYFWTTAYTNAPTLGFFDQPGNTALFATRGNVIVNNYMFPVSPYRDPANNTNIIFGAFLTNYMSKVLVSTASGLKPTLSTSSSTARLKGTAPVAKLPYVWTILDVYLPDEDGLTNGTTSFPYAVAAGPVNNNGGIATNSSGWINGLRYLGTYVVARTNFNVAPNLSAVPGEFELDICSLGLANGTKVTVAANYTTNAPGTHNPGALLTSPFSEVVAITNNVIAITSVTESGGTITICWCGSSPTYSLERTCTLNPPSWSTIASGLSGPCTTDTITGPNCYYRISSP